MPGVPPNQILRPRVLRICGDYLFRRPTQTQARQVLDMGRQKKDPASITSTRRPIFSPRRYSLSAMYPPNMPAPMTTTSNGSPPLLLTSDQVLHTQRPRTSWENSVC